ncbi:MAG: peptidoglycan glycosyltransferase [Opitutae bacterium]|nr:peptidoglycan glycosyltransferase [Opitutae bacterium]
MVLLLTGGLAFRQLFRSGLYSERERQQNQRRIIVPGPRGNILDRDGQVLVGNRPRFSVVLNLADLRGELRTETIRVIKNYRDYDKADRPTSGQLERIARVSVAQRYLDRINFILSRNEQVKTRELDRHFAQTLLLPYVLLDDLSPEEYARLIERLPVNSPLQVYTSSSRYYPFGSAASHVLGYTGVNDDPVAEDFPGEDLLTFKMKGSFGRDGLEKKFDAHLQGESGGAIYRVDPAGYKVDLPIEKRLPVQGHNMTISLDIELQQAAEKAMGDQVGSAVVLDVHTGEVLVMASKPDYDLNTFVPRLSSAAAKQIEESGGWLNRAIQGQYPPGSTFKIITAIAGLRSGAIDREHTRTTCPGYMMVGNRRFPCNAHNGHGERDLTGAVRDSCNIFFYTAGLNIGPELIAAEARRFGYDHPTGIELLGEYRTPHVATPELKMKLFNERWFPGDTANISIGQGDTLVSPLQVACMVASFARGETETKPTLIHIPNRPTQHTAPIGLPAADYQTIVNGMAQGYSFGTGRLARVDGLSAATKSGTAQKGRIEIAWMVCFAPVENPQIAIAICLEGQELDAAFGGGVHSGPIVKAILEAWKEKQERTPTATFQVGMNH